jgi:hypothetical protein
MTAQPEHLPSLTTRPTSAPGMASPASAPAGVPALLSPVPCPGTPPGTTVPACWPPLAWAPAGGSCGSPGWPMPPPASPTARWTPARWYRYGNRHAVTPTPVQPISSDPGHRCHVNPRPRAGAVPAPAQPRLTHLPTEEMTADDHLHQDPIRRRLHQPPHHQ